MVVGKICVGMFERGVTWGGDMGGMAPSVRKDML